MALVGAAVGCAPVEVKHAVPDDPPTSVIDASQADAKTSPPLQDGERAVGPAIAILGSRVIVDGRDIASTEDIAEQGRVRRIDPLFDLLRRRSEAWSGPRSERPAASLTVDPAVPPAVLESVLETLAYAYAGVDEIALKVGSDGGKVRVLGPPAPPCEGTTLPCAADAPGPVLHARAGRDGWRLVVATEAGAEPVTGSADEVERFERAIADLAANREFKTIVYHLVEVDALSQAAPYLAAVLQLNERVDCPGGVFLSFREPKRKQASGDATNATPPSSAGVGRLPPEQIRAVVRTKLSGFRKCYEAALLTDHQAEGKAEIRFVIDLDGTVSSAKAHLTGSLPPEVASCIEGIVLKLSFPAPPGGIVKVMYPVIFSAAGN